ncbi:MAG: sigma-70 family RNA polymerase sigma factor [Patescibacteria group bacterium]
MAESQKLTPEEKLLEALLGPMKKSKKPCGPITKEQEKALTEKVEAILKTLTYREREIIRLRYGIGDGHTYTLEEVGRIFNQNRDRVRQIEAKALMKLQHPKCAKDLDRFLKYREPSAE